MDWVTTSTILERLRQFDDQSMWERFHERFRPPIISFSRRFGLSAAAADDVAQETLMAFAEAYRRGKYDPKNGRLSSWLFGIAYRQAANARRKLAQGRAREVNMPESTSFWADVPNELEASRAWDEDWEKLLMERCLAQVRGEVAANTFEAFERVVRNGESAEDAAAALNMTRDAIYVAKHRVLKRLGELVKHYEELATG